MSSKESEHLKTTGVFLIAAFVAACVLDAGAQETERLPGFGDYFPQKPPKPPAEAFRYVTLENSHGRAEVSLFGAQVMSYVPKGGTEVLLNPKSRPFDGMGEIHGGIPVCWPSFTHTGTEPGMQFHGFARYSLFRVASRTDEPDFTEVTLVLESSPETRALWPYDFRLEVKVQLTQRLIVDTTATNTGVRPFSFTEAFHAYFRVADMEKTHVRGLDWRRTIEGEQWRGDWRPKYSPYVSAIFVCRNPELLLFDEIENRVVGISGRNATHVVFWNPGVFEPGRCQNLAVAEQPRFLCIEPAIADRNCAVTLKPGEKFMMGISVQAKSLTNNRLIENIH